MPRRGFRLRSECPYCGLRFEEESGVTLGTTVLGYSIAVVVVVVPLLFPTALGWLPGPVAIGLGVVLSFAVPALLYPFLLRLTLAAWFGFHPDAFEQEHEPAKSPYS